MQLTLTIAKTIQDLHLRRATLERTIAALEKLGTGSSPIQKRRGRKSMSEGERKEVSERIKRYWESRRALPFSAKASS